MNPRRLGLITFRDLSHNLRRPLFWIWLLLILYMTWALSMGSARIQTGDSSVGGIKPHATSQFAVAQILIILTTMIYGFFISVAAGMTVIYDEECRINELLHSSSLRPSEYVWGKFLAILTTVLGVTAIHLCLMLIFQHVLPAGSNAESRGPFHLANYLWPTLFFSLPTSIFFAGTSFAVGEWSRRPILVFFLPVAVFLACNFLLWDFSPSWLTPSIDRALMVLDPAGFRWLNETYMKVDRGAAFYNRESIPLDATIVTNRLLMLAIGLGSILFSQRHFQKSLRGESRQAARAWKRQGQKLAALSGVGSANLQIAMPQPLGLLQMTARPPGLIAGSLTVLRCELTELLSSPGLYLFVPLLVLMTTSINLIIPGTFDTPVLLTSGTIAGRTFNPLMIMTCLLLMFYSVESFGREHHTRLAAIGFATPVRTASLVLGKILANLAVGFAVIFLQWLASVALLLYQAKVGVELFPFVLIWGVLLVPTLLLWVAFVMTAQAITRNRYASYGIAIFVLVFTGYRQLQGEINWVGNWPLWGIARWSDISVFELDRSALVLNRIFAMGMAGLFLAITLKFLNRRDLDAIAIARRLQPWPLFKTFLRLLPIAALPLVTGIVLWAKVENGHQGDAAKKLEKDYWRKNVSTYIDWPLPDIKAVDVAVDIDPDQAKIKVDGTYELINNQDKPLRQIPVTGALHWRGMDWKINGKRVTPDDRSHLYIFSPEPPLPPGGTLTLGFAHEGTFPNGISKNGGSGMEFIVPSAVVLNSFATSFLPVLGYTEAVGIDDDNKYEPKEYPDDYYNGQTASFVGSRSPYKTKVKITGPSRLMYNSVGVETSNTVQNGKRTTVWESDQPVNFFNIVGGDWEVRRGDQTAIYYNKKHDYNINEMIEALNAARKYYAEWFHPFPWRELKLSEFPALASYAQGFPTDIVFSESIGFLTRSEPGADSAFLVTAHEAAHQWWGNIVAPGRGPGGNLVSEGTSHFSTLLLFEQVKGLYARIEFAKKIEFSYAKDRSVDSERPLVKIDGSKTGDETVTYDKTGWVFWMLMQQMGRERMLDGIKEFFRLYHGNTDHPVLQDLLAVLRKHSDKPEEFDEFTRQWFYKVVMPEYQVSDSKVEQSAGKWIVTAKVKNVGSGKMPVEVAATSGERFEKEGKRPVSKDFKEVRTNTLLGRNESRDIRIECDFKPDQIVVDPDAKVLQLGRKAALAKL